MRKFLITSVLALSAFLIVSCVEDDTSPVVINENPFALDTQSPVTTQLVALVNNQLDCLEMNFPITVATYSEEFVVDQTFTFSTAAELMSFIAGLADGDKYGIDYPFTITGNGEEIEITGNAFFLTTIQAELDECCITTNTAFAQAYNSVDATEDFTMDLWVHEYTFSVSQAGTVCSIGYKGEDADLEYLVQVVDADNEVVYTGTHTFSTNEMEYISFDPFSLEANEQYTIRRSIPNYDNGLGIGTIKIGQSNMLPVTHGPVTIHNSRFYGGGGGMDPVYNMLPMIDFVFKPQQP